MIEDLQSGKQKCLLAFIAVIALVAAGAAAVSLALPTWISGKPSLGTSINAGAFQICDDAIFPRIMKEDWGKVSPNLNKGEVKTINRITATSQCQYWETIPAPAFELAYGATILLLYVGRYVIISGAALSVITTLLAAGMLVAKCHGKELFTVTSVATISLLAHVAGLILCCLFFDSMRNHIIEYSLWAGKIDVKYGYCMGLAVVGAGVMLICLCLSVILLSQKPAEPTVEEDEEVGLLSNNIHLNHKPEHPHQNWQYWGANANHQQPPYMPQPQMPYRGPALPPAAPPPARPYRPPPYQPGGYVGAGNNVPLPRPPPPR